MTILMTVETYFLAKHILLIQPVRIGAQSVDIDTQNFLQCLLTR